MKQISYCHIAGRRQDYYIYICRYTHITYVSIRDNVIVNIKPMSSTFSPLIMFQYSLSLFVKGTKWKEPDSL